MWRLDGVDLLDARDTVERRRAADKLGDRMMEVFRIVDASNDPVTATDAASALDGMDGATAGKYLRRLEAAGYITRVGRGRYLALKGGGEAS
jgi:predicted transcriptional regulator of viral defense system